MLDGILMARILGYTGAIPFVLLALIVHFVPDMVAAGKDFLFLYGVVILSFLGGLHWGRLADVPDNPSPYWLVYSVLPSLIGWFSVMFPRPIGVGMLLFGFVLCAIVDLRLINQGVFAQWMRDLRMMLSMIAMLCLASLYL